MAVKMVGWMVETMAALTASSTVVGKVAKMDESMELLRGVLMVVTLAA